MVSGVSLDNNIGLFFKSEDASPTLTMLDDSKERQIVITNEN